MQVQVHYHGVDSSPWSEEFIKNRIMKLSHYLDQSAAVHVNVKLEKKKFVSNLIIHNLGHDFAFTGASENLYKAVAQASEKGSRALADQKQILKDKINRKFIPLKQAVA